jgi:xylose isomerase
MVKKFQNKWIFSGRLNSFLPREAGTSVRENVFGAIDRAGKVRGLMALELNYPQHFRNISVDELKLRLQQNNLAVSGVALRYEKPRYSGGAFTNPDPKIRKKAIDLALEAVDVCRNLGAKTVTLWMAYDGFDYPFQADYKILWDLEAEGIQRVADFAPDLRVSIEYKPLGERAVPILNSIGTTLLMLEELGRDNVGVTIDFCHALMAGERPAYSAFLACNKKKLFGIHLNDGYGRRDDGLMVARVHFIETLELLLLLRECDYDGMIYFDTFPETEDPVVECEQNIKTVCALTNFLEASNWQRIKNALKKQDPMVSWEVILNQFKSCIGILDPDRGN